MTFLESNVDTCSVTEWKNTLLHSSAASVLTDGNHKMNNLRDPCHFLRQGCNNRGNPHFVLYRRDLIFRSDLAYHSEHTTGPLRNCEKLIPLVMNQRRFEVFAAYEIRRKKKQHTGLVKNCSRIFLKRSIALVYWTIKVQKWAQRFAA